MSSTGMSINLKCTVKIHFYEMPMIVKVKVSLPWKMFRIKTVIILS